MSKLGRLRHLIKRAEAAETKVKELQDFAIWMTGCGYEFTQHSYFNKKRDELLLDYKQNDSCIAEQALKEDTNGRSKGFLL